MVWGEHIERDYAHLHETENYVERLFQRALTPGESKPRKFSGRRTLLNPDVELLYGRRLCITDDFRLGLVPETSKEGDLILLFPGAITPFIVRPKGFISSDHDERIETWRAFTLIGDCYIRGLEKGEGLNENELFTLLIV